MNPVIDSAVASPAVVAPGGAFVVTVVAHDDDEKVYTGVTEATDQAGNKAQASYVIRVADPLTFKNTLPAGFTSVPRAGQPGVFDCVAPA